MLPPVRAAAEAPDCSNERRDIPVQVRHVIDGDTVVLADGTHLRLIGIDTPELGHGRGPDEPWAVPARDFLSASLAAAAAPVYLVDDAETEDSYGRRLGHLFLADGTNLQAQVLRQGLATPITIPPNLGYLACYRRLAAAARGQGAGLWAGSRYQPLQAAAMQGDERGYRIVRGRVTRVGDSRTAYWLNLDGGFALMLLRQDLGYFPGLDISAIQGKTVEASGDVYRRNGQLRMRLRHQADIVLIGD